MRTLRSRLTLSYALVALIAVAVVALLASWLIQRGFDRLAEQQGQAQAERIAALLERHYAERGDLRGAAAGLQGTLASEGAPLPGRVLLTSPDWRVLFDSRAVGGLRGLPLLPRLRPLAVPVLAPDGTLVARVVVPGVGQEADLGVYEREFILRIYLSVLLGSLLAGAVALGTGWLIARRLTQPLHRLTDAARRLAARERHQLIPPPPDAELAELAGAFNTMAADLEQQQQIRRQLVADIAHELRTPLSVLRLQIEGMQDGVEQPTPEVLGSLAEEVGLLNRLVDDLRLLSLADAGQLSLNIAVVDAPAAAERVASAAAPRARQQGIDLCAEAVPAGAGLAVAADPQRLSQILGNLVENALRYTPAGGRVTLRVRREPRSGRHSTAALQGAGVVFEVADTGPGMPPEELARIFDRFYRTDRARTRETGGSGLGLAIVQRLTEMQGGRVWVESSVGRGTTFFIALPGA